jgi:regulator of cell morphogenesis and NO signaling
MNLAGTNRDQGDPGALPTPLSAPDGPAGRSLASLMSGIVEEHHAHARSELDRLSALAANVGFSDAAVAEVPRVIEAFVALETELRAHMIKEEIVVFPYIASLERALRVGRSLARSPFSGLERPFKSMLNEQVEARLLLSRIRQACHDYCPPAGATHSLRALYEGLEAFERALEEHVRIETESLFPRALELELRVRE